MLNEANTQVYFVGVSSKPYSQFSPISLVASAALACNSWCSFI